MIISQIVAVAKDWAIGKDNDLLWRLSADLKLFKEKTMGRHVLMGRKSFESILEVLGKPLPGRTSIVVTRNTDYKAEGCIVVSSVEAGIAIAKEKGEEELFITGGGQIYKQALPLTNRVYLTIVDASFPEADTHYPILNLAEWNSSQQLHAKADEKNEYDFSFQLLNRRPNG